eukprot:4763027-Prymnesium_polylepis.1
MRVLEEVAKQKPDVLIHLGDTYYSGTYAEQRDFLHDPVRAHLGEAVPVYLVPGNHDYYAKGGAPVGTGPNTKRVLHVIVALGCLTPYPYPHPNPDPNPNHIRDAWL